MSKGLGIILPLAVMASYSVKFLFGENAFYLLGIMANLILFGTYIWMVMKNR